MAQDLEQTMTPEEAAAAEALLDDMLRAAGLLTHFTDRVTDDKCASCGEIDCECDDGTLYCTDCEARERADCACAAREWL